MSKKIGKFTESHLLSVAEGVVKDKTSGSALLDTDAEERIPKFKLCGMYYIDDACVSYVVAGKK